MQTTPIVPLAFASIVFLLVVSAVPAAEDAPAAEPSIGVLASTTQAVSISPDITLEELRKLRDRRRAARGEDPLASARMKLARRPEAAESHLALAQLLAERGRLKEAIAVCKAGLARHPYVKEMRMLMADLYDRTGDTEQARREYRLIVTDYPLWVMGRVKYALLLERLDRRVEANQQWTVVRERTTKTTAGKRIALWGVASEHIERNN